MHCALCIVQELCIITFKLLENKRLEASRKMKPCHRHTYRPLYLYVTVEPQGIMGNEVLVKNGEQDDYETMVFLG